MPGVIEIELLLLSTFPHGVYANIPLDGGLVLGSWTVQAAFAAKGIYLLVNLSIYVRIILGFLRRNKLQVPLGEKGE